MCDRMLAISQERTNPRAAACPPQFPTPRGWDNPDRVTLTETSPNGPAGTYNHLYDAILGAWARGA